MTARAGSYQRLGLSTLLALTGCLPVCAAASDQLAVTAVRYWSLSDVTRIAIETNGPFTFKTDRLYNPGRVFFDLKGARPQLSSKGMHTVAINDPRVKQVRVAETQPSVTRIVIDLGEGDLDVSTSQLSVPERLVVEVRAKGDPGRSNTLSSTGVRRILAAEEKPSEKKLSPEPPPIAAKSVAKPAPPETAPLPSASIAAPKGKKFQDRQPEEPVTYTPNLPDAPLLPGGAELAKSESPVTAIAPRAAKRNSTGERSLTRALGLKIRRVVLDPGHGGLDHGTTGPGGLTEKDLVLDVTKRLGALIEERLGSEVIYTRTTDIFVPLEERAPIANANKADIFLSIHANASPIKTVSGVETYYLSFTTSRAAMDVAARENAASQKSISDLKELLQKIALREKLDESREFAARLQASLTKLVGPNAKTQRDRGIKKAPFVVLIGASMPAVLAEIGFVSNTREELLLKKPEYRQKLAESLFQGIEQYAESLSQFQVAQTRKQTEE